MENYDSQTKYLTLRELEELFGVSRQTLYRWRQRADFPSPVLVGTVVRYDEADIRAWAEARKESK